jgi:hypothetical protein
MRQSYTRRQGDERSVILERAMTATEQGRNSRPPGAQEFREICRREFAYLLTEYGFVELPPDGDDPYLVRFENATTQVSIVGRSFGYSLDVYVDRAGARTHPLLPASRSHDVQDLLRQRKVRFPIIDPNRPFAFAFWLLSRVLPGKRFRLQHDQRLQIAAYAAALRTAAPDVLRGDFSAVPPERLQRDTTSGILRICGVGAILAGVVTADPGELDPRVLLDRMLAQPGSFSSAGHPLGMIFGGVVLLAFDVYQTRRRRRPTAVPQE